MAFFRSQESRSNQRLHRTFRLPLSGSTLALSNSAGNHSMKSPMDLPSLRWKCMGTDVQPRQSGHRCAPPARCSVGHCARSPGSSISRPPSLTGRCRCGGRRSSRRPSVEAAKTGQPRPHLAAPLRCPSPCAGMQADEGCFEERPDLELDAWQLLHTKVRSRQGVVGDLARLKVGRRSHLSFKDERGERPLYLRHRPLNTGQVGRSFENVSSCPRVSGCARPIVLKTLPAQLCIRLGKSRPLR